jgi:peptide/nickel transport system ATP-binding protein
MTPALKIDGVSVAYDDFTALDDVSLSVASGQSFGLVGESGSGKSTLLRAVAGLAPVSAGTITVDGKVLGRKRDKAFYRQVQMVFQDPYGSLHPRQTVDRLLLEPLAVHGFGDTESRIVRALDEVGLGSGFRFRYSHQLSGGQRQRVAIARALILEPAARRADLGARRLGAGRGAEPARTVARRPQADLRHGQPRPRRRHPYVRPADGDAERARGGGAVFRRPFGTQGRRGLYARPAQGERGFPARRLNRISPINKLCSGIKYRNKF